MFHKHIILSGLQSAIKITHLIIKCVIFSCCVKRLLTICWILTCDNLPARKKRLYDYRRDIMMQYHAHYYKIAVVNRAKVSVTPLTRVRTNSPSGSRTRDSGVGGGHSNKKRQRLQPLASVARAPLFEVRRVRFTHSPYCHSYIRYTRQDFWTLAGYVLSQILISDHF